MEYDEKTKKQIDRIVTLIEICFVLGLALFVALICSPFYYFLSK